MRYAAATKAKRNPPEAVRWTFYEAINHENKKEGVINPQSDLAFLVSWRG